MAADKGCQSRDVNVIDVYEGGNDHGVLLGWTGIQSLIAGRMLSLIPWLTLDHIHT